MEHTGKKWDKLGNMLLGQFFGVVGDNNRVAFPKRFRDELGDRLIITKGFEQSLIVVSEKRWESLLEGTAGKPFTLPQARETQRFLLGGATVVALDSKGRFILPDYLKKYAGINTEVIFLGISRYVEIWDKKRWEEYEGGLTDNISSIAQRLSEDVDK